MEIKFCDDSEIESPIIDLIHRLILTTEKEKIKKVYDIFRNVYNGQPYPEDAEARSLFLKSRSEIGLLKNFALEDTDSFIGMDFPSWFNFSDNKPRIMMVGIDPLRIDEWCREVISIGSPYGIHDLNNKMKKENTKGSLYWELISRLAQSYSLYITDTFKVYFREHGDKNRNSYKCRRFTNPLVSRWQEEIHQKIFAEEVKIIQPKAIITLGAYPLRWFTNCKKESFAQLKQLMAERDQRLHHQEIPVLPFIHLSGRATRNAMKLYEVDKEKALPLKYVSIIRDHLKNINPKN